MAERRRRLVLAAIPGLAILAGIFLVVAMISLSGTSGWGFDFEAYFLAAMRLARGDAIYLAQTLSGPFRPGPYGLYLYAPPLAAALVPLTALSLPAAAAVWAGFRVLLLAVTCLLMPVSRHVRLATFAVAAVSSAVLNDLHLGNVSILVAFLSVVTWRWLDRPLGAAGLAMALFVRPTMGLVLIWSLLRRQWRPVLWTALIALIVVAATLPLVGVQSYFDYLRVLTNVSDVTGVAKDLDLGSTVLGLGAGATAATIALFGGYAIAIVAIVASTRRDRETGYVVTLGATLLAAPLLWDHYLVWLIIPAAFLAQRGRPWAIALPLLSWLPAPLVPLLVIVGTLLPFAARPRPLSPITAHPA